ncbi:MAG: tRNA adenosine(34) deaminase TadA [Clostridia bacterium]|nr:tRNA adenosine(34) deaminase TadA [Clostridia bacterium]
MEKRQKTIKKQTKDISHDIFMGEALELAKKALKKDEVPIGAVIVLDGKIIAKGYNTRQHGHDATSHAEIIAIRKACKKLKDFRLNGAVMYVTLEPCLMCLGAVLNSRIKTVYFGAKNNKENALDINDIAKQAELNHVTEFIGGVKEAECSELISSYFKNKRN